MAIEPTTVLMPGVHGPGAMVILIKVVLLDRARAW